MEDDIDPFELCAGDPGLCARDKTSWLSSGSTSGGGTLGTTPVTLALV